MGSTEPPSTTARAAAHPEHADRECAECGLPYDDGPHAFGTAGCRGCDPTLRLRALRAVRWCLRTVSPEPLTRAA